MVDTHTPSVIIHPPCLLTTIAIHHPDPSREENHRRKPVAGISPRSNSSNATPRVWISPALVPAEITDIEKMIETATPEQFQQLLAVLMRKMMVRGLKDIPPPKSIKEMQVLFTMFRQAEGIEARDRGGGAPPAGFLPRMVSRKAMGSEDAVIELIPEKEIPTEDTMGDDLFNPTDCEEKEFEI